MTAGPTVTCVIPTYRRPGLLRRAVNSVLNQSYRNVRIRVFDNASNDDTERVVRELASRDARVEYFRHERNIGAIANFTYGVGQVDTALFSILSDDDAHLPGFYEAGAVALDRDEEAMFFCGRTIVDHRIHGTFRHASLSWRGGLYRPSEPVVEHMIRDHFVLTGVLFRSELRSRIGPLSEHASEKSYLITAAATTPFVVEEAERAVFTIHSGSFSGGVAATGDRSPHDAAFVLQIFRETIAGLSATAHVAARGSRIWRTLAANARMEALYSALFQSLPLGRWEILEAILAMAEEIAIPPATRVALRSLALAGRIPVVRDLTRGGIAAVTRMISGARSSQGRNPRFEAQVAAYLAGDCEDPSVFS